MSETREPLAGELFAATRYLGDSSDEARRQFAARQLRARERLTRLLDFYRTNPSRMARIHVLTSLAVTLGRFCGVSETFDAMGAALSPLTASGSLRTGPWVRYREACEAGRPMEVRDELWMTAHFHDMEEVRDAGTSPTLFEVFVDKRIEIAMAVDVLTGGAVRIRARRVTMRGIPVPLFGLTVWFESRVVGDELHVDGRLLMRPKTVLGRFVAHRLLRRPEDVRRRPKGARRQ